MFSKNDFGMKKISVLKREPLKRFKDLNIHELDYNVDNMPMSLLDKFEISFIVLSVDSPKPLQVVAKYATKRKIPNVVYRIFIRYFMYRTFFIFPMLVLVLCAIMYMKKIKDILYDNQPMIL